MHVQQKIAIVPTLTLTAMITATQSDGDAAVLTPYEPQHQTIFGCSYLRSICSVTRSYVYRFFWTTKHVAGACSSYRTSRAAHVPGQSKDPCGSEPRCRDGANLAPRASRYRDVSGVYGLRRRWAGLGAVCGGPWPAIDAVFAEHPGTGLPAATVPRYNIRPVG